MAKPTNKIRAAKVRPEPDPVRELALAIAADLFTAGVARWTAGSSWSRKGGPLAGAGWSEGAVADRVEYLLRLAERHR